MLKGPRCTLELDDSRQELNATGDRDFGCIGFDELYGHEPGDELPWHWHEGFEAIICLEGTFRLWVANKEVALTPGAAVFINAWRPHAAAGAPQAHIRSITLNTDLVSGGAGTLISRRYVEPLKNASEVDLLVFGAGEPGAAGGEKGEKGEKGEGTFTYHLTQTLTALEAEEPGFEIAARNHASQLLFCAWQAAGSPAPASDECAVSAQRTGLMRDYIVAHYAEKLTVAQIAAAAGVSERECLRCFTRSFGVSPSRYLLIHRLSKAAELLAGSNLPVAEVGRAVGIQSPSNFAQLFRRDYRCAPRAYRSRAQGLASL